MAIDRTVPPPGGISCRELVALVTEYLEESLSGPLRTRFEAHLAACEGCAGYLDQMRATVVALGRLPPEDLPADVRARLLDAFRTWQRR